MSTSLSSRSASSAHPTRQQLDDLDALLKRMLDLPVNRLEDEPEEDLSSPPAAAKESRPAASAPEAMRGPHRPTFAREPAAEAAAPSAVNYHTAETEEADLKPRIVQSVPVAEVKETPAIAEARPTPPPAAPVEKPAAADEAADWVPLTSSWRPSARTWKPLSDAWREAQAAARPPAVEPPPVEEEPTRAVVPPPPPELKESREAMSEPVWGTPLAKRAPVAEQAPPTAAPAAVPARPRPVVPPAPLRGRPRPTATPARSVSTHWTLWPLVAFNVAFDVCLTPWGPLGRWLRGPTGRGLLGMVGLLCLTAAAALAAADWIGWTR